jgi:hypothetical protein
MVRSGTCCLCLAAIAVLLAGCGGQRGTAPRRVIEREETVGKAPVKLRSELVPARGTLGDRIAWRLTASLGPGVQAQAPLVAKPPESLDLDASKAEALTGERSGSVWSREYVLRGFDLGAIALPQAALAVTVAGKPDTLEFPPDTLFVDSLTAAATGTLRPDRGAITPPLRPVDYAVLVSLGLLLAAAIAYAILLLRRARRRARIAAVPLPPEPPEAALDRALQTLEAELTQLPRDVFYERLSLALRTYAAAAASVPAPDLTTAELDRELARHARVMKEGRESLIGTLRRADLAKFGRFEDEESEARSILLQARSISGRLAGGGG